MSSSEFRYTNGPETDEALNLSDSEGEDEQDGDYSTRMEELFADDPPESKEEGLNLDDEEEEEGFLYTGNDADLSTGYRDQLRDVLEDDPDPEVLEELQSEDDDHDPLVCPWAHII